MSRPTYEGRGEFLLRLPRAFAQAVLVALLLILLTSPIRADEIYFKSGYSRTAVVIRNTEDTITFKTEMGISTISHENVDFVEKATDEENQLLLRKWRKKELEVKEAREARRAAQKRFEEAQLAKGLIKFEGIWMVPEEKRRILELRKQADKHRREFEATQRAEGLVQFQGIWVTPEREARLREMEPEIYRLYNEIITERKTIGALRSAMVNVTILEEAERFSKRIQELDKSIAENSEALDTLLNEADEIAATSVRYKMPEEFLEAFSSGAGPGQEDASYPSSNP